jgi:hypothetical protein
MMGRMSQEPQASTADPIPPLLEVVEIGDERPPRVGSAPLARIRRLTRDRRLVPLIAGLGAVALGASMLSEWQVTSVDGTYFRDDQVGNRALSSGIGAIGGWGGGYLAGVVLLSAAMALLLFGPAAGRAYARVVALSAGVSLVVVVLAIADNLHDDSQALEGVVELQLPQESYFLSYGRGLWCALFGVLAVLLAAWLAGRHVATAPTAAAVLVADAPLVDWSWRRPGAPDEDDPQPDHPYDLTVSSAAPFTPLPDAHDAYRRPDGISG